VRTSPFRSAAYSLRCKTEKFEAILFPCCSRHRCLRTADRRAPMPEATAVQPKCAKSSSGAHARPSHAKVETPLCSTISTSYCRRPRPASCTPSRCRRQRHRCRMDLPGPTTSVGTKTDYSVGPWDYPACATRHLTAWSTRTAEEKYSVRKLYMSRTIWKTPRHTRLILSPYSDL
jgi:hypothetical protein